MLTKIKNWFKIFGTKFKYYFSIVVGVLIAGLYVVTKFQKKKINKQEIEIADEKKKTAQAETRANIEEVKSDIVTDYSESKQNIMEEKFENKEKIEESKTDEETINNINSIINDFNK